MRFTWLDVIMFAMVCVSLIILSMINKGVIS